QGEVELFDFDQNTGELTNPLLIDQVDHGFGLCFSPDGNLLYLGTWVNFDQLDNYLYQYDLSSNEPDVIGASRVTLDTNSIFNPFGSMRVAPNGKLYVAYPGEYLGVINNPDTYGEDCDWEEEAFFLGEFSSHYGLNCLWETPPSPSSNSLLELGDNISSCTDVTIGSEVEGAIEYSWNTNSSEPFITINESGTYELTVSLENCDLVDQIEVEIGSLSIDLGENISLCEGESTTIGLEIADAAYSWNTSDDTPFIEVSTPGTYTLSVDQNDCQAEDSISVIIQPLPIFELPNTIEDCPEVSLSISPPDGSEVSWSNGIQGNNAIISESEEIAISAFLNGCQYTASVDVIVNDPVVPPAFSTLTCANESAEIFAPDGFVFSDQGTPSSTVLDLQPGIYDLEILDNCGAQTWTVNIEEEDCECDLFFPNVFTPNNDNKNEQFIPSEKCPEAVSYQIFNRWGQLVFDSEENSRGWDGNDQNTGEPLEDGVYFYKAKVNIANQPADFNGTITLLR
ncbi:MAG: gliding motility-associated C-terminal domain-containing protein, partial [Flavobacteriales bacterium]|nr:gliding motility-associated C-terminal domain-containing protein [Flavobacteriales bacterium]